jgi:hypothetical protein
MENGMRGTTRISPKLNELFDEVQSLYVHCRYFYFHWFPSFEKAHPDIPKETVEFILEAQMFYGVRGKRYQIFELDYLEKLLIPHDEEIEKLYAKIPILKAAFHGEWNYTVCHEDSELVNFIKQQFLAKHSLQNRTCKCVGHEICLYLS